MRKVYKKLTKEQKERGVIFSSCLSVFREEMEGDRIQEVFKDWDNDKKELYKRRLLDDKFFNKSHFKFNIIRR